MRIGMLADVYKPHISGVTNHIALTKKYLEKKGHEVYVFTFGDEDYQDDEPNVIRSSGMPMVVPVAEIDIHLNLRYSSAAQILLNSMDVVHVHHPLLSGRLAIRYCGIREIPIIFTNHTRYDLYYQAYLPWMPEVLGDAFLGTYLPSFCKSMDMTIAPSAGMKTVLRQFGVNSLVEVVPNGVDLKPNQNAQMQIERSEFGFKPEDIVLIYVGRLGLEKNLPFLLKSFSGIVHAYENVKLLIVGDGAEKDNLEDSVAQTGLQDLVHFTGLVPYEELPGYLNLADIFTTASITEVHPLTVIEAMAAGLPIMGIESTGVGDIVEDGVTGFLSDDDLAGFTAKLIRLVTEKDTLSRMSERAKIEAQQYAIERTAQLLIDRYEEVIARKQKKTPKWISNLVNIFDKLRYDKK